MKSKQDDYADMWSFFDHIYCITLQERPDRRAQAHQQFTRVGIADRVEYFVVRRHPFNSEQGIYESHLSCLRAGLAAGANHMVVFEDDVVFAGYDPIRFAAAVAYLRGHPDWKLLFLGCLMKRSRATASPAVRYIDYGCLAHAYAVNRSFAGQVAGKPWRNQPYDAMLRDSSQCAYAVCPMFAFQSNAATDNVRRRSLDRIRRWCGGLRRIQKINEWYHRHVWWVAGIQAAMLALFLLAWRLLSGGR